MYNHIEFQRGAIDASSCISNAWEMLKRNYGMFLGVSLLAYVLISCIPCVNVFILGPVMAGVYYVALRDMRGEPVEFGMMFKGFEKFMPLMVIGLIQSIPGIIMQILQYAVQFGQAMFDTRRGGSGINFFQASDKDLAISGVVLVVGIIVGIGVMIFMFFWWACFFFALPLAMEHDLGAMDAIKLSTRAAMSNIGGLLVLMIFVFLVGLLGVLMLCVGIFLVSVPVIFLAQAFAYRQVFPWVEQQFNMNPPPPTAYGDLGTQPLS